jgi:hypothetical protein
MEGASWMATKVIKEKEKSDERDQELFKEFDNRLSLVNDDPEMAIRIAKWLKEALEVSNIELAEAFVTLQDSAQYNMEEAMRRVQKIFSDFEPNVLSISENTSPTKKSILLKSESKDNENEE